MLRIAFIALVFLAGSTAAMAQIGRDPCLGAISDAGEERGDYVRQREVAVVDGDTISVRLGYVGDFRGRVRLLGVDAPEKGMPGHAEATQALRKLLQPCAIVFCRCEDRDGIPTTACRNDRYGRALRACRNDDGLDLAQELVREGLARARYGCKYASEERFACSQRKGIWANHTGNCVPDCD